MKFLSLTIVGPSNSPQFKIDAPSGVPTGGLEAGGAGQNLIQIGINLIFLLGIVLAIVFIIISGIQWILSGGDKQKVQAARGRIIYSIVGLLVIFGAFFIINTVVSLLGGTPNDFLNTPAPTP